MRKIKIFFTDWTIKDSLQILLGTILAIIIALVIISNIQLTKVYGQSMMPSIQNKEYLLCNTYKLNDKINRYDVIVFQPEGRNDFFIKRVIGLPGETIDIVASEYDEDGNLIERSRIFVNGKELLDDVYYLEDGEDYNLDDIHMTLAEDEYFVLGDNRNDSHDSRSEDVGAVSKSSIDGVVINKR